MKSWLESSGASDIESDSSLITCTSTVRILDKMLDTKYRYYTNGAVTILRTTAYSLPEGLEDVIDFISPTTHFSDVKAPRPLPITSTPWLERPQDI